MIWLVRLRRENTDSWRYGAVEFPDDRNVTAIEVADEARETWMGTYDRVEVAPVKTPERWDKFLVIKEYVERSST